VDFELTETAKEVQDAARAFAQRLKPQAAEWEEAEAIPADFLREGGRRAQDDGRKRGGQTKQFHHLAQSIASRFSPLFER